MLVDQVPLDPRDRASEQPTAGIEQGDLGLRLGLQLIEHARQRCFYEDATHDAVAQQDRTRRRQRGGRRAHIADVLVPERVVGTFEHRLHHRLAR